MADRDDEFFQEMKSKSERDKEWTDAAQFYIDVRRESPVRFSPEEQETEKVALTLRQLGMAAIPVGAVSGAVGGGEGNRLSGALRGAAVGVPGAVVGAVGAHTLAPGVTALSALGGSGLAGYAAGRAARSNTAKTPEKTAGLRDAAQAMYGMASKVDGSGIVDALGSKGGRIAALGGAALFGIGTALASRGKKELGGKSQVEHEMAQEKAERHSKPEPEGFGRKLLNNVSDFNADLASTARKHPVKAGLVGALGGAKAGVEIHKLLGKLK